MKCLILNFFLLVLGIPLNLSPDISHKYSRFSKTFPKKALNLSQIGGIILLRPT